MRGFRRAVAPLSVVRRSPVLAALGLALLLAGGLPASAAARPVKKAAAARHASGHATRRRVTTQDDPARVRLEARRTQMEVTERRTTGKSAAAPSHPGKPTEIQMRKAGSFDGDLRTLPETPPRPRFRPEREPPPPAPVPLPGTQAAAASAAEAGTVDQLAATESAAPTLSAPAPAPSSTFDGLDFTNWGAGHPPDTNGDVGPTYYIQTINTSIGIFRKSDGVRVAAFTFDTFMSQGNFGNLCDTDNFGDPVVLYDSFEDRWVVTDFAFQLDASGNVVNPPGNFQCFAVSKTGDPVSGGWNYYSINTTGGLGDYPKLGVWPDGIYMSVNMFDYASTGGYQNPRLYAFNKAQMYAGAPTVQVVSFDAPASEFTLLPSNARLQTGTPPTGTPNYFSTVWNFLNSVSVYKFHVDWNSISTSTLTGPFDSVDAFWWAQYNRGTSTNPNDTAPSPANNLDTLYPRLMVQNQYSNLGGVESLWVSHTVGAGNPTSNVTATQSAVRYYQVKVTGGTVEANNTQSFTYSPDTTLFRFMPSVAVDRQGNMAIGYSTSNATTNPALQYAGRLAGDAVNSITQTEQLIYQGTGSQSGNCGSSSCTRWGDYSAMSLDPDGCTFWYTNEYYAASGLAFLTRIANFAYPSCTPVGVGGTVSGTVTATVGGSPISGATVALGSRTTTTNGSGVYAFTGLPAGTYPSITASAAGYVSSTSSPVVVSDSSTTTVNFSLTTAATSACLTDTTQADFQTGVPNNTDLTSSAGNVVLASKPSIDQQNTSVTTSGAGFDSANWAAQSFTPAVSGQLTQVDLDLFCYQCTGSTANITVGIRNASGDLPTGGDLASGTIAAFTSGAGGFFSVTFASPPTLTAGTKYTMVIRAVANNSAGTYAFVYSSGSVYGGGRISTSSNSGSSWGVMNPSRDMGFKTYMKTGYSPSGDFTSSLKDSNPASGATPTWSTISWNATVPANTTLKFQVAASNSSSGPFNFVGPDGTAATYFTTSGASLTQFNGFRYLEYKAYLATTNSVATPTLNDVTLCFSNAAAVSADLAITKTDGVTTAVPGGSVTYTIVATNNGPGSIGGSNHATVTDTFPAGLTCTWTCLAGSGGSCAASGSGSINDATVQLQSGSSVTYTTTCTVSSTATGSLSNTATISGPVTDGTPGNNSATDTDTLTPTADVSITKTDGVSTATPGGSVTYTITASNAGPSAAPGSTVADTFPGTLTCSWTCAGSGGGTCTASGSGNIADIVSLPTGGSVTYTATCNVAASASGSLSNTATVATSGSVTDPTAGNNSATDTDTLVASADLQITKTDGTGTAVPGSNTTYTITVTNAGPSNVTGASVADTFPLACSSVSFTSVASGGATGNTASGFGNIADTVNLPKNATVTYTAVCAISASATGSLSNTATVSSGVTDPTPANNSATDTDTLTPQANLGITKTDGVTSAVPGNSTTYTITATNAGPSNVTGATVADTFPATLTCTWTCVGAGGGTCTASGSGNINDTANLPNGASVTYTASCNISSSASGTLSNTATVSAPGGVTDPTPGNNSATDSDTLTKQADLGITKTDGVTSAVPGGSVSYTITASNAGPSNATATVADTFPASLTCSWTCVGAGAGTCAAAGSGNINDATVSLPNGGSVTYTASCTIAASATGSLANTATVTAGSGITDANSANNSSTDTDSLTPQANLGITKTDGVTTAVPGSSVTYTITASNAGPSNAPGSTVADTFQAGLTCTWTCTGSSGGTCTASGSGNINDTANLPSGGSVTYTASCAIAASATGSISNTATVTPPGTVTDATPGNNTASDTDTLTPQANLGITKTDGVTTAVPGGPVTYTITASNAGPSNAPGSTVADSFPGSLTCTWTSSTAGGATGATASGSGNISDTVNLPSGGSVTYTASCTIAASATTSLANTATVAAGAGVTDPTPGNNSATDTDTLTAQADLSITKTDGVGSVTAGGSTTYTITAANAGPSNASGVTVADTFPASLTCSWTCAGASGGTCTTSGSGSISDSAVNLPSGGSVTYTASCSVSAAASGSLSNTATVTAPGGVTDLTSSNNSATDTDTVTKSADLAITKTDGVTTATPGGNVTYTIKASNAGPSNASGSTVADTFPASLTCTWTCSGAGGGTCTTSGSGNINDTVNLPSGGSVTYTASCTISAAATGSLSNTATVAAAGGVTDPTPGNNSATDSDTLDPSADVSITKTDGVTTATPGGSVTYTITASNAGPSNAPGSTVADTFPASLTCTWTCAGAGGGTCTASGSGNINDTANLPSGGSATYTASCTISASASGSLSNTATVAAGAGVTDPTPGNNSATDTDTLSAAADLSISKTDGVASVTAGGSTIYTIKAANAGPSNATGATVADTFPASLTCTWTCAGAGGGTCTASGGGNINDSVNLPSGGSVTYTASCSVASSASGSISNTATVTPPGTITDGTPGNNSATDTDTVTKSANLAVTKDDGVTAATAGGSVTYTIIASNAGPSDASGATVADTFVSALTCTWTCVGAGGGTCTASGSGNINDSVNLPSGGSVTYTASCTVAASASGTLSNTATVTAPGGVTDPAPGNNSATDIDTVAGNADLSITKTDGVTEVTPGGAVTYTIAASNAGPSDVTGATVADVFPVALTCTWTCAGAGGGTCTASGSGSIGDTVSLPGGGSVTYTASCTLSASASGSLTNTATVAPPLGVTDGTPGNNSATDTDTVKPAADLSITKTDGVTSAVPGGSVTYTITAANTAGPSDAAGSTVTDTFPGALTCTWTCGGAGGGTCTASGSGNISDGVNLPVGGSVTYTATCTVSPAVTGTLSNTATVAPASGIADPTPGNNSATDTDSLGPQADLSVTKTDGTLATDPSSTVVYVVTAANAGPSNAPGATVTDTFQAGLTCNWTCSGSNGGTCTASGSGNINETADLPSGGSVTYTATCTVAVGKPRWSITNQASVAAPAGVSDANTGNNIATDVDQIEYLPFADGFESGGTVGTWSAGAGQVN